MSEPKGPSATGDAAHAKKSSKKSSSRAPAAQAEVSSPPVNAVPTVPRIPLSEPKPEAEGADSRRKPSKKRTSTTSRSGDVSGAIGTQRESTPPGPAVPSTQDANAALEAAAKQKEEAEKRREAKRQRAKEAEDAKRREELANQALEEAKRLEEQRQREARQKQQIEALNANAEECLEEAEDEYGDDGFENYDEDFEQEEVSQPKSTPLPAVGAKASKKKGVGSSAVLDEEELKKIQQAMQAETKGLQAALSRPSSSSESTGQGGLSSRGEERSEVSKAQSSIASSIAGLKQSLDPRAKRAKEILEHRKFEVEKFTLFQQNPVSEQDKVMHRLRRGLVKQAFVQTSDGARSLGTQTKSAQMHDKAMHFPDDIGVDTDTGSTANILKGDNNDEEFASSSSARFFKFLEHAAYVCEILAVENVMASEAEIHNVQKEIVSKQGEDEGKCDDRKSSQKRYQLSQSSKLDKKLVFPTKEVDPLGSLEQLLQGRDLVALRFSPAVSSTLLTCYGAVREDAAHVDNQIKLYADKTIACIWDVNLPNRPSHLLKNEGIASTACLSPSRDLFVIVGTEDGSIHLWDLRPQSMIQSTDSLFSGFAVCTPAYSTCGMNYRATEHHTSTIVALEPISRSKNGSDGGTFQFGSMDDRGILIIWSLIEFETGDEALISDKCVQIGGRVKMVMNARIDMQQQYLSTFSTPKQPHRRESRANITPLSATPATSVSLTHIGPVAVVMKCFPDDPNQYVA
ncbi:WD repeat-containing protein 60 [Phytophthora boehmeriae]|uniref:WD repeat-containing protein 60 n=1 Tax=Phytophthora boehmeriae TaxID=109152 RepID=A0A8T1VVX3_9STRA|nr:WD repeat-containing protein 60 [Phytophthora boehmeriae]